MGMRIVHVNPFFFPYMGGIERRIQHLGAGLAKRGHDVTVVTARLPGTSRDEEMEGVHVLRVPARVLLKAWNPPVLTTSGTAQALRDLAPDVVDYHSRWAPEMTKAVSAHARAHGHANAPSHAQAPASRGAPFVFTFQNHYGEGGPWLRALSLANDAWNMRHIRQASRIVCVSGAIRDELAQRGIPAAQMALGPNGCDPPRPGAPDWQPDDGREAPAGPYLMTVGRLTPEKGAAAAIAAFARAQVPDAKLLVCGTGPLAKALRRQARALGVEQQVRFEGWVPEATKFRLLAGATGFLHLPAFEAYGIVAAEAIVAGAPVLAADVGGLREVVGDAGVLVAPTTGGAKPAARPQRSADGPEDSITAAQAIRRIVEDDAWRATLAAKARRRAPQLSWQAAVATMEGIYREVVNGRPPASPPRHEGAGLPVSAAGRPPRS